MIEMNVKKSNHFSSKQSSEVPSSKDFGIVNKRKFEEISRLLGMFTQNEVRLGDKHQAAAILGVSPETLKKYRLQENSTLIENLHYYRWNSRTVRYNLFLLWHWGINRKTPEQHHSLIESYAATLSVQQRRTQRSSIQKSKIS